MGFRLANVDDRAVLVHGELFFDVEALTGSAAAADPMIALTMADQLRNAANGLGDRTPTGKLADVVLGPPVPRPQKSFGVGLNYLKHAEESSMELPKSPLVFTKFPSCIVGPTATVEMRSDTVDYEGEVVVVIGTAGRDIAKADAWDHIVGVTVGQDVSDRRAQFAAKPPHFDLGKSFDTFGPTGPVMVSVDEVADRDAIPIMTQINGETRQQDTTANLIFDIPTLVAYLSRITTLVPGDLIFTGTPDGVGAVTGAYLTDGDVITTTVDGVGTMTNPCVRSSDYLADNPLT